MKKNETIGKEGNENPANNREEEFVFRFDFSSVQEESFYADPIVELFRRQISNLLEVVVLMDGEKQLKIDGFKFLNDSKTIYQLFVPGISGGE
jgi:hypothetical protein